MLRPAVCYIFCLLYSSLHWIYLIAYQMNLPQMYSVYTFYTLEYKYFLWKGRDPCRITHAMPMRTLNLYQPISKDLVGSARYDLRACLPYGRCTYSATLLALFGWIQVDIGSGKLLGPSVECRFSFGLEILIFSVGLEIVGVCREVVLMGGLMKTFKHSVLTFSHYLFWELLVYWILQEIYLTCCCTYWIGR